MALTFPLSLTDFWGKLPIASFTFELGESVNTSKTAAGEVIVADLGSRLWSGSAILTPQYNEDAAATAALISVLRQGGRYFFAVPAHHPAPTSDPDGSVLTAFIAQQPTLSLNFGANSYGIDPSGTGSPAIASLSSDGRSLSITGLPAGYVLSPGDFLSFTYLSSPTRYALHQIVGGATADSTGTTALMEVTPSIRTGAAVGSPVTLVNPYMKAIVTPGRGKMGVSSGIITGSYESRAGISRGSMFSTFDFMQTLR
ncbi:MAG: hypothetical protein KGL25_03195 [Gammaproteobacteria bacterium]|nr:hypothetical protein [Gammaproteobacteria bacterium]